MPLETKFKKFLYPLSAQLILKVRVRGGVGGWGEEMKVVVGYIFVGYSRRLYFRDI